MCGAPVLAYMRCRDMRRRLRRSICPWVTLTRRLPWSSPSPCLQSALPNAVCPPSRWFRGRRRSKLDPSRSSAADCWTWNILRSFVRFPLARSWSTSQNRYSRATGFQRRQRETGLSSPCHSKTSATHLKNINAHFYETLVKMNGFIFLENSLNSPEEKTTGGRL